MKRDGATFNEAAILVADCSTIDMLKREAKTAPYQRYRLCLHRAESDAVQEMVIALRHGSYVRPHRHPRGKTETYLVLEGRLDVFVFDTAGAITRQIRLSDPKSGEPFIYHLAEPDWHMPVARSEDVVYFEVLRAPSISSEMSNMRPGARPQRTPRRRMHISKHCQAPHEQITPYSGSICYGCADLAGR